MIKVSNDDLVKLGNKDAGNWSSLDLKDKYELFGLTPPPFPVGSKLTLQNVKKTHNHGKTTSKQAVSNSEGQVPLTKEYIQKMRSAYESMGIKLPAFGTGNGQSDGTQSKGCSVYELFGLPLPNFLGGNLPSSETKQVVESSTIKGKGVQE